MDTKNIAGTPAANGKASKPELSNLHVAGNPPKAETKKEKPDLKPLEDRVLKVQQLSDLVYRREKLQETLRKLKSFKLTSDGRADSLRITDGNGNEFSTSNSLAIKDVVATLKESLQKRLEEVEITNHSLTNWLALFRQG